MGDHRLGGIQGRKKVTNLKEKTKTGTSKEKYWTSLDCMGAGVTILFGTTFFQIDNPRFLSLHNPVIPIYQAFVST